ncbi:precorrin-6Y C5,15-methyltransferase (decarboxylating) subunit CbiT, partial [Tenacibaculum sp.]|nr:precorrin-6Y C5,15-methyltransferase (decarboxylating) subunit CbiT [Tenacibaculum sp.]
FNNYTITIGEDIEGENENIASILSLKEASLKEYHPLNCILLHKNKHRSKQFGIKNNDFIGLEGRPNMITKMPIRLTSLHLLDILDIHTLWDIGFCTGSISIEAKLKNPNLNVIAFEKRVECEEILLKNQQQFGAPGIKMVMGDFFEQDITNYPKPDAIFIGGHGGRLKELLENINEQIQKGTRIVINAVQERSILIFIENCKNLGWTITDDLHISLDLHNPIRLLKAVKN